MLATFAIAAALSLAPAQAGDLKLTNVRCTYGTLGPVRADDQKFLPGDVYFVRFDIEGLKVSEAGEAFYKMGMTIKNSAGKEQFKQEPIEHRYLLSLGGTTVPAFAHAILGADTPPGEYVFEVNVYDPTGKRETKVQRKFQLEDKRFGIVRLSLSDYPNGQAPMPYLLVPGQMVLVNFGVVGFQRDSKNKQPDILTEMRVVEEKGKTPLTKPIVGETKDVPKEWQGIPMQFVLSLNRTGRYSVQLKAVDQIAKKTVEQSFDIIVVEPK